MPFTGSHVAAVLPLVRSPFVPSALVAGSVAPDLPFFVLLRPAGVEYTHTWWGVVLVDLPIALVALAVYRVLLFEPALALAPDAVRSRLAHLPAPRFGVALVGSAVLGTLTHLFWDGFTHATGWAVALLPGLNAVVGSQPLHQWGQWGSTAVGGLVVAVWCLRRLSALPRRPVPARLAPPARPLLPRAAVVLSTAVFAGVATEGSAVEDVLVGVSITVTTGAACGLALYGLWRRAARLVARGPAAAPPAPVPRDRSGGRRLRVTEGGRPDPLSGARPDRTA
ncbi:DUF4184 family protein [Saccharothrix sp. Mg75]|uniref:DUF4184 family protein n=1 Tax=Saccharothrix sp. Mg75 TaxID=3445357 RepID=UPI003EEF6FD3